MDEVITGQENTDQTVSQNTDQNSQTQQSAQAGTESQSAGSQPQSDLKLASEQAEQFVRSLTDLGITPENAHEYVQTREQYNALLQIMQDPKALLDGLRINRPDLYEKILDTATDHYLELHPVDEEGKSAKGADSEVVAELRSVRAELNQMRGMQQQAAQQQRLATVVKSYNDNLDSLIQKIPGLKASEQKAIKALVSQNIAADRVALGRINQGVFVDLPRHIKDVYTDWANDHKAELSKREEVKNSGSPEITPSAQAVGGQPEARDDWDSAAVDFANALQKK